MNDFLKIKRNALKGSSVSSLSNLLALDDQKSASKLPYKETKIFSNPFKEFSIKSLTLPGSKANCTKNSSSRYPVFNVNFQSPNKSKSTLSLNKSATGLKQKNSSQDHIEIN